MREHLTSLAIRYNGLDSHLTTLQERAKSLSAASSFSSDPQSANTFKRWLQTIDTLCLGFHLWGRDIKSSGIAHDDSSSEVLRVLEASDLQEITVPKSLSDAVSLGNTRSKPADRREVNTPSPTSNDDKPSARGAQSRYSKRGETYQDGEQAGFSYEGEMDTAQGDSKAPQIPEERGNRDGDVIEKAAEESDTQERPPNQEERMETIQIPITTSAEGDSKTFSQSLHDIFDQVDRNLALFQKWIDAHKSLAFDS